VLSSTWFTGGNATVIIMMDEGLYAAPANQIPMVITSTMLGAGADPANSDLNGWFG
jgi:hypothetical protein